MASPLTVLAGPDALAELRSHGLRPDRVRVLAAASGGPKGLVLHGLDRVLFPWLLARRTPLHAVGSSIGSWRLACLAQPDPVAALERSTRGDFELATLLQQLEEEEEEAAREDERWAWP